jgi:hypothetical protein
MFPLILISCQDSLIHGISMLDGKPHVKWHSWLILLFSFAFLLVSAGGTWSSHVHNHSQEFFKTTEL